MKDCVEKHLKDKVWDVKLPIHANTHSSVLIHEGSLNAPVVEEIAILMPDNNILTKNHMRYVTFNYRNQ